MEDNIAPTSPQSFWQRLFSLLAKVNKYQALLFPVLGLTVAAGGYLAYERSKLQTLNELLQKRLEAEETNIQILKGQHSEQLQTYELRLKWLEKQLEDERTFHEKQIQWLNAMMAFQGNIPESVIERFNSASQQRIAQR